MSVSRSRLPLSVRAHVFGLILVILVPSLAFSAYLVIRAAQHEQELLAGTVQGRARAAARDIERLLATLRSQLFIVANAGASAGDDPASFLAHAAESLRAHGGGAILSLPDGSELLNTSHSAGTNLPRDPDPSGVRQVATTGQPFVSDLVTDPTGGGPAVMIHVPVMQAGRVAAVASRDVLPALEASLLHQQLPADWLATVIDRDGYTLARSREASQYVGQPGRADFLARVRLHDEGSLTFSSRDNVPNYFAFSHIRPVGWTVVVGIPLDVLYAPVRRSTYSVLLLGGATLALALLLALLIGHRIAAAIAALMHYADVVVQGMSAPPGGTGLRETDRVACSLARASDDLHRSLAERQRAAAALQASEQRKQVLHQSVQAQEAERKRIARELHDTLGQYLTALQLGLNGLGRRYPGDLAAAAELSRLRQLTGQIGAEVNRMAWELRPTALDDLGLETAIAQYLEEWAERTDLHFDLQVDLGGRRLPQMVETTVYRALQEAVTNVVRHAEAEHVAVILEVLGSQLQMIIEDDGRGFQLAESGGELGTLHLGLLGIRERLALVEGTLEVESARDAGTTLYLRLPISDRGATDERKNLT
jgi:signal transduction histidine kinase